MNSDIDRRSVLERLGKCGIVPAVGTATVAGAETDRTNDEEVYVVLSADGRARDRLERSGYAVRHELAGGSVVIVEGPAGAASALRSITVVEDVFRNRSISIDSIERPTTESESDERVPLGTQWDKRLTNAAASHDTTTGTGTTVAIIDTGVDHSHPALKSRLDTDRSRLFRNGTVRDGVETVPIGRERLERPVATDVDGHGTHIAGIAAASGEDGVVGMAPDATIVSLRTFFEEPIRGTSFTRLTQTLADVLVAIEYAVAIDSDVVNLAFGSVVDPGSRAFSAYRRLVQHAIENGTLVVTAAGNAETDLDELTGYDLPGQVPGTINVAATGPTDRRSHYSNYGNSAVDVAAPGGGYETRTKSRRRDPDAVAYPGRTNGILSTFSQDLRRNRYGYKAGTSMAAANVSGAVCLLRALRPDRHARRIKQAIERGAVELTGEYTSGLGAGRLDVARAIDRLPKRV